ARRARFSEAHVVEAIAATGAGRLTVEQITAWSKEFIASEGVVRLVDRDVEAGWPRLPRFSARAHLALERQVIDRLAALHAISVTGVDPQVVDAAIATHQQPLGDDQAHAVRALCETGPAVRSLVAPPGFGKTTAVHAAAVAQRFEGHLVLGVATTNQAVNELRDVGIDAVTLARLRIDLERDRLATGTVVILDEVSQVATVDAAWLLDAVAAAPGAQLWCLGDPKQAKAVRAGGLAAELQRLGSSTLTENRRQLDPAEQEALSQYRAGHVADSQHIRKDQRWEHDLGDPAATRQAMAHAVVADIDQHGVFNVAALAVSHADCEDLADRIRHLRYQQGELAGPTITGPGWFTGERQYAAGDLVLVHANVIAGGRRVHNGTVVTVSEVTGSGLAVSDQHGHGAM
ncbi:MAG: AAA family ATPase, partial [Micromonosporaceae bacterium]